MDMQFTEQHFAEMLQAMSATAKAAASAATTNAALMQNLIASVDSMKTELALLRQQQLQHADEQAAMVLRLFGTKDDGIIYRQNDRIEEIRVEQALALKAEKVAGQRQDVGVTIVSGFFSFVTAFAMSKYGSVKGVGMLLFSGIRRIAAMIGYGF